MTAPVWADELRRELVQAAARRRRRRRLPLRAALAAGAVAMGAAALASGPTTALAEVRVDETGGRVVVTLLEIEQDPHRVEASLRAAGFDVAVEPVATGPSAVGRFVATYDSGPLPTELVRVDGSPQAFLAFSLPAGWDGALRLFVGRPAAPGEAYHAFTDALAPEEPLGCLPLLGRPAAQAADAVAGRPAHVAFRRLDQPSTPPLPTAEVRGGPFADWVVLQADAVAPDQVVVWLGPPGSRPHPGGPHTCDP